MGNVAQGSRTWATVVVAHMNAIRRVKGAKPMM